MITVQTVGIVWIGPQLREYAVLPVEDTDTASMGTYPEGAPTVFQNDPGEIAAETVWIMGIRSVAGELARIPVERVEASSVRADP